MRPPKRIQPGPGQESVWDYPRPPALEPTPKELTIILAGQTLAHTRRGWRVLETSHPPVYYFPPEDIQMDYLQHNAHSTWCEWKGPAFYYDIAMNRRRLEAVAWYYPDPTPDFEPIRNFVAFYPNQMDACYVGGERVRPQPGGFYGGWITRSVVGPFKGEPGSEGW
ncbi:MAG: hypothetical protein CMH57_12200 [Myxococcales bacterium]|nr:hypothetical protein [Myxococcales bacterium]